MANQYNIFCDGGSRGNPGPAASAFVIFDDAENKIYQQGNYIGHATNNTAEYMAVLNSLNWLKTNSFPPQVSYYLDSQLVVRQLQGIYKIKDANLQKIASNIKEILLSMTQMKVNFFYVPREKNSQADALVNTTLDSHV